MRKMVKLFKKWGQIQDRKVGVPTLKSGDRYKTEKWGQKQDQNSKSSIRPLVCQIHSLNSDWPIFSVTSSISVYFPLQTSES